MKRKLLLVAILLISLIFCSCQAKPIADNSCLTVYFFDVGQADSSLLIFPDGLTVLIDAGNDADGEKIAKFLKDGKMKTIDYLILTHPHEDHIGGASDVIDTVEVKTVCLPYIDKSFYTPTKTYSNLLESIKEENAETVYLSSGKILLEKNNYCVEALSPSENSIYSDLNDYSVCLKVDYFTNTLLFMGDAEEIAEKEIMATGKNLDADILKVGHHGSSNSSCDEFLKAVSPKIAIISCGKNNSYGHPHSETLDRLNKSANAKIYRTDTVGTVIVKLYDGGFNVETDRYIDLNGNN